MSDKDRKKKAGHRKDKENQATREGRERPGPNVHGQYQADDSTKARKRSDGASDRDT